MDPTALIQAGDAVTAADAKFAAPLDSVRNIIAVGLNYRAHAHEVKLDEPTSPLMFAKWSASVTGPHSDVEMDSSITKQVDYEVELAVVIGIPTLDVSAAEALHHVAGYAVANDISARDVQFADTQWTRGKSFNGFCPIGPWITTPDEISDPQDLRLTCAVNGRVRQQARTDQMIFPVAELISYASRSMTLMPGDVILTGTPAGVAMGSDDPQWLVPGDVVRCEIDGLGALENHMVERLPAG
jgi:5-carboxymethyl-2-hydroxymuconate isomerase